MGYIADKRAAAHEAHRAAVEAANIAFPESRLGVGLRLLPDHLAEIWFEFPKSAGREPVSFTLCLVQTQAAFTADLVRSLAESFEKLA